MTKADLKLFKELLLKKKMMLVKGIKHIADDALDKIEEGKYGLCDSCEKKISKVRLKAVPYAELCVPCQEKQETKRKK